MGQMFIAPYQGFWKWKKFNQSEILLQVRMSKIVKNSSLQIENPVIINIPSCSLKSHWSLQDDEIHEWAFIVTSYTFPGKSDIF